MIQRMPPFYETRVWVMNPPIKYVVTKKQKFSLDCVYMMRAEEARP